MALTRAHYIVSAYPDGHPDRDMNEDGELDYLKQKVDAGAEFIITQLFYDVDRFLEWHKKVRAKGRSCARVSYHEPILQCSQESPFLLFPV